MRFVVHGRPAPQGSKRAFVNRQGKAQVTESSKAVAPWRSAVAAKVADRLTDDHGEQEPPWEGPLALTVTFYALRPKSHLRANGEVKPTAPIAPAGRPDLDKFLRSTMDGLTDGGMWRDDSQVVTIDAAKRYCNPEHPSPCAVIDVLRVL